MSCLRGAFRITAEREREISARIAEAVSRQRDDVGDAKGADAAKEIARLIREDGLPAIRQAFLQEVRQRSEAILSKGLLGPSAPEANQEIIRILREIDPSWSGKQPVLHDPIKVRTRSGLSPSQLLLKRRHSD